MEKGSASPLVFVVDDDGRTARMLAQMLRGDGFRVEVATDGATAIGRLSRAPIPAALVTDLHLPHADGLAVARYARSRRPALPVFVVTGHPDMVARSADPLTPPEAELFTKPLDYPELLRRLQVVLGLRAA